MSWLPLLFIVAAVGYLAVRVRTMTPATAPHGRSSPSAFVGSANPLPAAAQKMRQLNGNALWGRENGKEVFIEDVTDPDGRMYRLEYQTDLDGQKVIAFCRHNPWGSNSLGVHDSHLFGSGQICLGTRDYSLEDAVQRARYWATAYSYLREHGHFPSPT